jgi:hypothetical protein
MSELWNPTIGWYQGSHTVPYRPLSLVRITGGGGGLLEWKSSGSGLGERLTDKGTRCADHTASIYQKKWLYATDKRGPLGRHTSLWDWNTRSLFVVDRLSFPRQNASEVHPPSTQALNSPTSLRSDHIYREYIVPYSSELENCFSEKGSVTLLRWLEGTTYSVGSLRQS